MCTNGTVTLHGTSTENTNGNNGSWPLSLSQTNVNISACYYSFHLVPVPVSAPVSISVNKPLKVVWQPYLLTKTFNLTVTVTGKSTIKCFKYNDYKLQKKNLHVTNLCERLSQILNKNTFVISFEHEMNINDSFRA